MVVFWNNTLPVYWHIILAIYGGRKCFVVMAVTKGRNP